MSGAGQAPALAPDRTPVLVCLDLQPETFAGDPQGRAGALLRNCRRVLAHTRRSGWRIVHVLRRAEGEAVPAPIAGLEPLPTEPVMLRPGLSAFSSLDFSRYVRRHQRPDLVLIGFPGAPAFLATALVASDEGVPLTLVDDAGGASPDHHDARTVEAVTRLIIGPYVGRLSTDQITGERRGLRVVT